jgi:hypothetical protein
MLMGLSFLTGLLHHLLESLPEDLLLALVALLETFHSLVDIVQLEDDLEDSLVPPSLLLADLIGALRLVG